MHHVLWFHGYGFAAVPDLTPVNRKDLHHSRNARLSLRVKSLKGLETWSPYWVKWSIHVYNMCMHGVHVCIMYACIRVYALSMGGRGRGTLQADNLANQWLQSKKAKEVVLNIWESVSFILVRLICFHLIDFVTRSKWHQYRKPFSSGRNMNVTRATATNAPIYLCWDVTYLLMYIMYICY